MIIHHFVLNSLVNTTLSMDDRFLSLLESIRKKQAAIRSKAISMRREKPDMIKRVVQLPELSLSVCAVDGGLFSMRLHGSDIVATRAVGVHFVYEGSKLDHFDHYPTKRIEPEIEFRNALDEHEANVFRSLVRLKHELSCAISLVEKYSPNLLLMDGSLWTVPSDRPQSGSELASFYSEIVSLYKKLFALCDNKKTILCGVIKDSRSRRLAKDSALDCSDTMLCDHLLEAGERTFFSQYFEEEQKELGGFSNRLKVFYLKPSEQDLPLRIEFLSAIDSNAGTGSKDDDLASIILSLSSISETFAYPAILVEADMCAAMDAGEIEHIQNQLLQSDIRPLRRNSRPFR
jgi:hypothetical protein